MDLGFDNYRVVAAEELSPAVRRKIGAHAGARVEVVDILADPELVTAIAAAYASAPRRIEQTIFFGRPVDQEAPRLGALTFDEDSGCWRAEVRGVRFWISGDSAPDPAQVRLATTLAGDLDAVARAVEGIAPGGTGGEPTRVELPWPPAPRREERAR